MKHKKIFIIILLLILIAGFLAYRFRVDLREVWDSMFEEEVPVLTVNDFKNVNSMTNDSSTNTTNTGTTNTNQIPEPVNAEPKPLPDSINLEVPFTSQAPHANWELPYQEACEEASAITVHYFFKGKTFTKDIADQEILDLVEFENSYFGDYKDTTAEETAEFIREYWGYERVDVIYDPTIEDIKRHVAEGRPIIVPAAGRQLGNPNFTSPGPIYHMFVVRGYSATQFITNDVGTRMGENYRYDYNVVMDAMHDWNNGDVDNGQKVVIAVYPNN